MRRFVLPWLDSVQESRERFGRSVTRCGRTAPLIAVRDHRVESVFHEKGDCFLNDAFGLFGRLAHAFQCHAHARAALEIGTEGDMLFGGDAQGVVEQGDRTWWTHGIHHGGNCCLDGFDHDVAQAAADLPGLAFDEQSFVVNSAMKQAIEVLEGEKGCIDLHGDTNRIVETRQHGPTPQE